MRRFSKDTVLQTLRVKAPTTLLPFLLEHQVRKSRSAIKSLLLHKQVKVNGKLATQFDQALVAGDVVEVMKFNQARKQNRLKGLTIVFEDEHFIIADKEAGLLSVGTDKEKSNTVFNIVNQYVKAHDGKDSRIYVLHRLDREVSGLIIFAKSENIQAIFQKNWDLVIPKFLYSGIVEGKLVPPAGMIKTWLTENKNFVVFSSFEDNGGLEAITEYKTLDTVKNYSLLEFDLKTRRKNQIRAQLNALGHPIVGDRKYGAKSNPIKRIALFASYMLLKHPVTGQLMEFKCTIPKPMRQLMDSQR